MWADDGRLLHTVCDDVPKLNTDIVKPPPQDDESNVIEPKEWR